MKIYLLDCTLRDGGYVNNWEFGEACIHDLPDKLTEAGADIIELGFIRKEKSTPPPTHTINEHKSYLHIS